MGKIYIPRDSDLNPLEKKHLKDSVWHVQQELLTLLDTRHDVILAILKPRDWVAPTTFGCGLTQSPLLSKIYFFSAEFPRFFMGILHKKSIWKKMVFHWEPQSCHLMSLFLAVHPCQSVIWSFCSQ